MKYRLINNSTKEEHLCDKVTIDGFDYYVSDEEIINKTTGYKYCFNTNTVLPIRHCANGLCTDCKKIIATNYSNNIDIPKVMDYVEKLAQKYAKSRVDVSTAWGSYADGYNKSQETHPFSEEDMIEFAKWRFTYETKFPNCKTTKKLLQLWKEQQPKIFYYE